MIKDNDYYNSLDKDSEEYRAYAKFNGLGNEPKKEIVFQNESTNPVGNEKAQTFTLDLDNKRAQNYRCEEMEKMLSVPCRAWVYKDGHYIELNEILKHSTPLELKEFKRRDKKDLKQ